MAAPGTAGYKPADSKREEFRKYLEKSGVLDSLTKVLVSLYEEPEKPVNAVDFLKHHISGGPPETADVEALMLELTQLKEKNKGLEEEVADLKAQLEAAQLKETTEEAPKEG